MSNGEYTTCTYMCDIRAFMHMHSNIRLLSSCVASTCATKRLCLLLPLQVTGVFESLHEGRIMCAAAADENMILTGGDSTVSQSITMSN